MWFPSNCLSSTSLAFFVTFMTAHCAAFAAGRRCLPCGTSPVLFRCLLLMPILVLSNCCEEHAPLLTAAKPRAAGEPTTGFACDTRFASPSILHRSLYCSLNSSCPVVHACRIKYNKTVFQALPRMIRFRLLAKKIFCHKNQFA